MTIKHIIYIVLLICFILIAIVYDIREFIYDNNGISFYKENPLALIFCFMVAATIGITIHVIQTRKKKQIENNA